MRGEKKVRSEEILDAIPFGEENAITCRELSNKLNEPFTDISAHVYKLFKSNFLLRKEKGGQKRRFLYWRQDFAIPFVENKDKRPLTEIILECIPFGEENAINVNQIAKRINLSTSNIPTYLFDLFSSSSNNKKYFLHRKKVEVHGFKGNNFRYYYWRENKNQSLFKEYIETRNEKIEMHNFDKSTFDLIDSDLLMKIFDELEEKCKTIVDYNSKINEENERLRNENKKLLEVTKHLNKVQQECERIKNEYQKLVEYYSEHRQQKINEILSKATIEDRTVREGIIH